MIRLSNITVVFRFRVPPQVATQQLNWITRPAFIQTTNDCNELNGTAVVHALIFLSNLN
jgi:hypothetical protein